MSCLHKKYGKFLQAISSVTKHSIAELNIQRLTNIKEGEDNIKPTTPYNFDNNQNRSETRRRRRYKQ